MFARFQDRSVVLLPTRALFRYKRGSCFVRASREIVWLGMVLLELRSVTVQPSPPETGTRSQLAMSKPGKNAVRHKYYQCLNRL